MTDRDLFNRPDNASLGTDWTALVGTNPYRIISDAAASDGASNENCTIYNAFSPASDHWAAGLISQSASNAFVGPVVRASGTSWYVFYADNADRFLARVVSGTYTALASASGGFAVNDVVRLEVEGTTLRCYINGVLWTSVTDSSLSSGSIGMATWSTSTSGRITTFSGDNLSSGPTYTLDLTGAVTPVGTLANQGSKLFSGAFTPAGALSNREAKVLAGELTPAGTLSAVRSLLLVISGELTPDGTLTNRAGKVLAGALIPAGALANRAGKLFSGAITPAADLARRVGKVFSGALSPTGEVTGTGSPTVNLIGAFTPEGSLASRAGKVFSGALSPVGTLGNRVGKALAGAISPSGQAAISRALQLSISGAIAPAGTVARSTGKALVGALIMAGILLRLPTRSLNGALDLAGTLTLPIRLPPVAAWWPMLYMSAKPPALKFVVGAQVISVKVAARMIRVKK